MKWAAPGWLFVVPVVLGALAALWAWTGQQARQRLQAAFRTPLLGYLERSVHRPRRRWKLGMAALGIGAVLLALARPQWGRGEIEVERTGVDLMIALDVSRSMLAADAGDTNRLAAAVKALSQMVEGLGGDRVGLVLFAGEAYLAAPLTRDHTALTRSLAAASPWMVSEQGSDLGKAIRKAMESFDRSAEGPRVLLVVSDGEQLEGDAIAAAQGGRRDGVQIHTAGVGSASGARLPRTAWERNRYLQNAAGREVVSRRDEHRLQRIAAAGGGRYVRLAGSGRQVLAEWVGEVLAPLARTTEKLVVDEPREQYQWPLAAAVGLLMAAWVLSERRQGRASLVRTPERT